MCKKLLLLVAATFITFSVSAQKSKYLNTTNMTEGIDALYRYDYENAVKWFFNETIINPKNGYAHYYLAHTSNTIGEYGSAIDAADLALKYLPKKDKVYRSATYNVRAQSYLYTYSPDKALSDWESAIKTDPQYAVPYYDRAIFFTSIGKFEDSKKDFLKYIELKPSDPVGYLGLGTNSEAQKQYNLALYYYDKALSLDKNYCYSYVYRAKCYMKMERFDEAIKDIINSFKIKYTKEAEDVICSLADSAYRTVINNLQVQAENEKDNVMWQYILGAVQHHIGYYEQAVENYKNAYNIGGTEWSFVAGSIANCYLDLRKLKTALQYANYCVESDDESVYYRYNRTFVNYELNDLPAVKRDLDFCVAQKTTNQGYYYYVRGYYYFLTRDFDNAINDFTSSLALTTTNRAYTYMLRGRLLMHKGDNSAARKDLLKCIELDTIDMSKMCSAIYAYHFLGNDKKALQLLDTLKFYNKYENFEFACIYSLMNKKEEALHNLKKALENGYNRFNHIELDPDLDNIRNEETFKSLVRTYKSYYNEDTLEEVTSIGEEKISEIPYKNKGGVTEVNCKINGLPLYFIFDTGATDVLISSVEAAFMLKNGYLSQQDILGSANYLDASGNISEGTVINIASIEIGDVSLKNVRASIAKNQNAPLLLGQSVLKRFGKIEIDNKKQVIRIFYNKF